MSPRLPTQGSSRGDTCPRGSGSGGSAQLRPDRCDSGVIGAAAESGSGEDLTTCVDVAIWRAHNSNLVLWRGRHSDIDRRQGDAIPISDQVKQQDNSSRLKASHRESSTGPQPLIPHALKQQRCRCGRCYGLWLRRWWIDAAAA
jgi:hypothetical protein